MEHQCFTVDTTTYLRNLDRDDLREEAFAVHYQKPPRKTETGTAMSLRFPMLIVAGYLENKKEVAEKVARILEKHWETEA